MEKTIQFIQVDVHPNAGGGKTLLGVGFILGLYEGGDNNAVFQMGNPQTGKIEGLVSTVQTLDEAKTLLVSAQILIHSI